MAAIFTRIWFILGKNAYIESMKKSETLLFPALDSEKRLNFSAIFHIL